jgi:hypothetical protein
VVSVAGHGRGIAAAGLAGGPLALLTVGYLAVTVKAQHVDSHERIHQGFGIVQTLVDAQPAQDVGSGRIGGSGFSFASTSTLAGVEALFNQFLDGVENRR